MKPPPATNRPPRPGIERTRRTQPVKPAAPRKIGPREAQARQLREMQAAGARG